MEHLLDACTVHVKALIQNDACEGFDQMVQNDAEFMPPQFSRSAPVFPLLAFHFHFDWNGEKDIFCFYAFLLSR